MTQSPRFYGNNPPYQGKPQDVSKDLITSLEKGIVGLYSQKKENYPLYHRQDDPWTHHNVLASYKNRTLHSTGGDH